MGSALLKAFVGGAIIFECSYKPEYKHQRKRFCKTDDMSCLSNANFQPSDKRISLFDTSDGYFRVLISALTLNDTGTYMCIMETTPNVTEKILKTLIVSQDPLYMQSTVKSGYVGADIVINCPYPPDSIDTVKYFYRQRDISACPEVISSWGPDPNSRHALVDDSSAHVFNVTIRKLTAEDDGIYWCGVRAGGSLGGIAMTTEVKLQVFGNFLMSTTEHGTLISSVTEMPPVLTHSTLSTELVVIILLILIVVALLLGVLVCRCRSKRRQVQVSAFLAVPQGSAAVPPASTGAIQMDSFYESVDPMNSQPRHDYQNVHPEPTFPDRGDPEMKPTTTTNSPSGHIYEPLRMSRKDADSDLYLTVEPEPNEQPVQVSAFLAVPQGSAAAPSVSEDPKNSQPRHDYQNVHPEPTFPDKGDSEMKPTTTTNSSSEHIYQPLRMSRKDADSDLYLTVEPEPNEQPGIPVKHDGSKEEIVGKK